MAITYIDEMSADSFASGENLNERWQVVNATTVAEAAGVHSRYMLNLKTDADIRCRKPLAGWPWSCAYVRFNAWPSSACSWWAHEKSDGTDLGWLVIGTDGSLLMGMNGDSGDYDTNFNFSLNTWYIVSWETISSGAMPYVSVRDISGTVLLQHQYAGDGSYLSTPYFWRLHVDDGLDFDVDNWVMEDSQDPYTTITAPHRVLGLWINAAGDTNQFDSGDYQSVDERPMDGDTTYIEDNDANSVFLANMESVTSTGFGIGNIVGVQANYWCQSGNSGQEFYPLLKSGGTLYTSANQDNLPTGGGYSYSYELHLVNPITSTGWNESEVDALQIGIKHNGGTNNLKGSCFYVEILASVAAAKSITWW
jgi:hypothetical protein